MHYPILPSVVRGEEVGKRERMLFSRHPSLFTPRDFDVSPYFKVIKPMLEKPFNYHNIVCWGDPVEAEPVADSRTPADQGCSG